MEWWLAVTVCVCMHCAPATEQRYLGAEENFANYVGRSHKTFGESAITFCWSDAAIFVVAVLP